MPKLRPARAGQPVLISQQPVHFARWPIRKIGNTYQLQPRLFVTDPWPLMAEGVERSPISRREKDTAHSLRRQAEDYFRAANLGGVVAARPVLLYYAFLNLAKTFLVTRGNKLLMGRAGHGLKEATKGRAIVSNTIKAVASTTTKAGIPVVQVFDELLKELRGTGLRKPAQNFSFGALLAQVLPGHRLWCYASGKAERFVSVSEVLLSHDPATSKAWLSLRVERNDLARLGTSGTAFLREASLRGWVEVIDGKHSEAVCLEPGRPLTYSANPLEVLNQLTAELKNVLWETVKSVSPYRKYYLYRCPSEDRGSLLPQLTSLYAIFFLLGSVTRYFPDYFDILLESKYDPLVQTLLAEVPTQFLYMMASEFLRQEVSRPAII